MRHLWPTIYVLLALSALWSGYQSLAPQNTANTNADWVFVSVSFVGTALFPTLALAIYGSRASGLFPRPSFRRRPVGFWRTDPLQLLRLTMLWTACSAVGALCALPATDQKGVMLFWWWLSLTSGLFLGERLACLVHRRRIA